MATEDDQQTEPSRITEHTREPDHVATGVARLIDRLSKPKIQALVASWLRPLQAIEDVAWTLLTETVENAVGAQLNQLGEILDEERGGLSDAAYRVVLRAKARALRSLGTWEDLIELANLIFADAVDYTIDEQLRATVFIQPEEPLFVEAEEIDWTVIIRLFRRAKAAGVRLFLLTPPDVPAETFQFASGDSIETDADTGYAEDDGDPGGQYADAVV